MPRKARKNITASYIHVITQGIKKEYIFQEDEYKMEYLKLLENIFEENRNLYILAYCIMDNHAHLLIYAENIKELSSAMNRVNTSYGIFYNKRQKRVGYVFRNRYYTQEIMNERHLYNAIVYIHKNPVKAKMVRKMENYLYSSYSKYQNRKMNKNCIELLFHTEEYNEIFNFIHKNFEGENIMDIDEEKVTEEEIKQVLETIYKRYGIKKEDIRKNNYLIMQIYKELKNKLNLTNKEISNILGIGKNRILNIMRKD